MEERNYTVYRHIAPNGKMYVGITSQEPKKRWKNGRGYRFNQYFSRAIEKYGWDNLKHEVLLEGLTKEQAELAEQIFIAYWDLTNHDKGYNINHGGQVHGTHSKATREKMSMAKKGKYLGENNYWYGKKFSEKHRRRLSETHKGLLAGKRHPLYGKHHTEETRRKMSANRPKKAVVQLDKDTLKFVAHFESTHDAHRQTGVAQCLIQKCCAHKGKTAGGYCWEYYEEYTNKDTERRDVS